MTDKTCYHKTHIYQSGGDISGLCTVLGDDQCTEGL